MCLEILSKQLEYPQLLQSCINLMPSLFMCPSSYREHNIHQKWYVSWIALASPLLTSFVIAAQWAGAHVAQLLLLLPGCSPQAGGCTQPWLQPGLRGCWVLGARMRCGKLEAPNTSCLRPKALRGQLYQQCRGRIPAVDRTFGSEVNTALSWWEVHIKSSGRKQPSSQCAAGYFLQDRHQ